MIDALGAVQSVALVGGTSEIGLAIVRRLGAAGRLQRVVLAGRDPGKLAAAADGLRADLPGVEVTGSPLDVVDLPAHAGAVDSWFDPGSLDVVVLAAGVLPDNARALVDADYAAQALQTNAIGPVHVGTLALNRLREQGSGVLVVISSVSAERPRADVAVYAAGKAALDSWAQAQADHLAGSAVQVLVVRPGFVHTRMTAGSAPAPLATDVDTVAAAVASGIARRRHTVWAPGALRVLMSGLRHTPRPLFRLVSRRNG